MSSDAIMTTQAQSRRHAGDYPDDFACARLIRHGEVVLEGEAAVRSYIFLREMRAMREEAQ
jgi:hypothetical protein